MYIVDTVSNSLVKVQPSTFHDLKFEERKHLQEWIAKEPESLGEELLIIQKEFDGFSDTKERLDLLALDKDGNLVIIENKLDDSGRDVTWQAIKYASYCSSLSKKDVIEIYQKYLGPSVKAEDSISEFFDGKDVSDIEINLGNSQRIFFVAAKFRKEVTSSVMWLLNYGIRIKCFKVTPYKYNDKVLLDFDQIIPVKDADDYTIKIASKNLTDNQEAEATKNRHNKRSAFWQEFIDYNKKCNGPFAASSGTPDNWLGKSIKGMAGLSVSAVITSNNCRVEVYTNSGNKEENKAQFDYLFGFKDKIEAEFGSSITWERRDELNTSRALIESELCYQDDDDKESTFKFLTETTDKFLKVFGNYAIKYNKK